MSERFPNSGTISSLRDTLRVLPTIAPDVNLNNPAVRRIAGQNRPAANVANAQISFSDLYQRGLDVTYIRRIGFNSIISKVEFASPRISTSSDDLAEGLLFDFSWGAFGLSGWSPAYRCNVTYSVIASDTNSTLNFHSGSQGYVFQVTGYTYEDTGQPVFANATIDFNIEIPSGFGLYGVNLYDSPAQAGVPIIVQGTFGPNVRINVMNYGNLYGFGGDGAGGTVSSTGGTLLGTVGGGRGTASVPGTTFFSGIDQATTSGDPLGQQGDPGTTRSASSGQEARYISGSGGVGFNLYAPSNSVAGGTVTLSSGRGYTEGGNTFYTQSIGAAGAVSYGPSGGSVMSGAIAQLTAGDTQTVSAVSGGGWGADGRYSNSTTGSVSFYQVVGGPGGSWGQAGNGIPGVGVGQQPGYYLYNASGHTVTLSGGGAVRGLRFG